MKRFMLCINVHTMTGENSIQVFWYLIDNKSFSVIKAHPINNKDEKAKYEKCWLKWVWRLWLIVAGVGLLIKTYAGRLIVYYRVEQQVARHRITLCHTPIVNYYLIDWVLGWQMSWLQDWQMRQHKLFLLTLVFSGKPTHLSSSTSDSLSYTWLWILLWRGRGLNIA